MRLISPDTDLYGIDCHMHSRFSPDAKDMDADTPQRIADEVRRRGLRGFIITDHIDIGHWGGYIIDFDKYFKMWERVRKNNPDLTIYIGLEAGFEKHHAQETAKLISDLPFEYVINSVHYYECDNWHGGRETVYAAYLRAVLDSLDAPYPFSTIGHLGLPERYSSYPPEEHAMSYDIFAPLLDEIIQKAVRLGARFELNTNGGDDELRLPRADFLRAYKAAGGRRPVLGADAHSSDFIAYRFDEATALLDGIFGKN